MNMICIVCNKDLGSGFEGHEAYHIKCKQCFDEHEAIIGESDHEISYVGYKKFEPGSKPVEGK